MPRLAKAKKQESWRPPTESTTGQSERCGQASRPRAAIRAKVVAVDIAARLAASQIGEPAIRPIFIAGQVRPNNTIAAASCSHAARGMGLSVMMFIGARHSSGAHGHD